jgi:hypothetical protein
LRAKRFGAHRIGVYLLPFDCLRINAMCICISPDLGPPLSNAYVFIHSHEQKCPVVENRFVRSSYLYGQCKDVPVNE